MKTTNIVTLITNRVIILECRANQLHNFDEVSLVKPLSKSSVAQNCKKMLTIKSVTILR